MFLKEACKPRPSVFDGSRRDVVLNISDLLLDRIDSKIFFDENYLTSGMRTLIEKTFARLENSSDQASAFLLTQAMGGGKTHSMIALGLLAKHPKFRIEVMGANAPGTKLGRVKVIGFNGRETDAPFGIWGSLAEQLSNREVFKDHYTPLKPPGVTAWVNLLKGEQPTLIFLDELAPYLETARATKVGNSDLAVLTCSAISTLLVALDRPELNHVCLVLSDLSAAWEGGSGLINNALDNLQKETGRSALRIEPVNAHGTELFHILRTRIFEKLPNPEVIKKIANDYAEAVRQAREMEITNASPDSYAAQLIDSYPFHSSLRELYARFKENPGFQQTRGLIRLMRAIVANLWQTEQCNSKLLIHPYDIDLNNEQILSEIKTINPSLGEAIAHDIAREGHAIAEQIDARTNCTDAQDVAKLILVASLAQIPGASHGLRANEIGSYLCAPGRDLTCLKKSVIDYLPTQAWYLHPSQDGRLFFKNVQNLAAKLHSLANSYNNQTALKELRTYLSKLFLPKVQDCYQKLEVLPALDEVRVDMEKITLIIVEPSRTPTSIIKLKEEWESFVNDQELKNRVLFLTGNHETMERIIEHMRLFKAIETVLAELNSERISHNDPQYLEADRNKDQISLLLRSALQETFTTLVYPSQNGLRSTDCRINFDSNHFDCEKLIRETLEKIQKFTTDIASDSFKKKCEKRLFGGRKTSSWNEVRRRAASLGEWPFHHPGALDNLKQRMLEQGVWFDEGGVINIDPPMPETCVHIQESSRNEDNGEVILKITPVNGDIVRYEIGDIEPTTASLDVGSASGGYKSFKTTDMRLKFKCFDTTGKHKEGPSQSWKNRLVLKYKPFQNKKGWCFELKAIPAGKIKYTTEGSDPKRHGGIYEEPFLVPDACRYVLAIAEYGDIESPLLTVDVNEYRTQQVNINPVQPTTWLCSQQGLTGRAAYNFLQLLERHKGIAYGINFDIIAPEHVQELCYCASPDYGIPGNELQQLVEKTRSIFHEGELQLAVECVKFANGQSLKDWFAECKIQPQPGEVQQS